jgi:ABC-2 type transport system ATP-binding protein
MLATLLSIDGGTATVAGFDVKERPKDVRKIIGYVGQTGGTDNFATGRENLALQGRLYGMSQEDIERNIERLTDLFDLKDIADRLAKTYSGGQKRRLEVALGLVHDPRILFLDEPTAGLDPHNRANLWAHVNELKQKGMTILLTTHYLDEADRLCDRVAIIDHGMIVAIGTPKDLKDEISGETIKIVFEIDSDTEAIAASFRNEGYVKETRAETGSVYLIVNDGGTALPQIFELLKDKNITAKSVSVARPTLDDVFLKLTGRSLRD